MASSDATNVDAFAAPSAASTSFQAVLHFVCYVHREGVLCELNGQKTARCRSDPEGSELGWLSAAVRWIPLKRLILAWWERHVQTG